MKKSVFTLMFFQVSLMLLQNASIKGQNTYEFLRLDYSPRAAALAGSFVAANDDPNTILYNPAGVNFLKGSPISFSFLKYLMDINSASLIYSKEFEGIGRFAAAIQYINYGNFTEATYDGVKTGEFSANDIAFTIGYGNELGENFYYGINAKFIYSSIAKQYSSAYAFDLGLHYSIPQSNWNIGFAILNLGSQITPYFNTKEELPLDIRLGFTKQLEKLPFKFYWSFNRLNEKQNEFFDRFQNITIGGEFIFKSGFNLRFGYDNQKRKDFKIGTTAGLAGFNLGFGFLVSNYKIDYAFSSLGSAGSLHRIGISTEL
ncbi:type IX secretion system protein PorQ [Melioribacteraceae bacterium 4301-Me]|uniref:type IX secretion system protein PorQ n=1 Tax=Pyranulibacter aquaticus TaxID=3163344 RepID=UPI003595946C